MRADRAEIQSTGSDLAYVTVEIVDRDGAVVKSASPEVTIEVSGAGELIAGGSADPASEALYTGKTHKAYGGRLLAIVRSQETPGEIVVKARAEGLEGAEIMIIAK